MLKRFYNQFLAIVICLLALTSCTSQEDNSEQTRKDKLTFIATDYFKPYTERINMTKFMSFYDDSVFFSAPIPQIEFHPARELENFYNWSDTSFRKHPDFPETLIIERLLVSDDAVESGSEPEH